MNLRSLLTHGATLLGLSALLSKGLSFVRDRLVLDLFETGVADGIYASFRVPDFLFYLLIASTISVTFIPRIKEIKKSEASMYFSSFFWGICVVFGLMCGIGAFALPSIIPWLFPKLDVEIQLMIVSLSRWLFLSSFLLALNALCSAYLQWKERFFLVALFPLFYVLGMIGGLWFWAPSMGPVALGLGAVLGISVGLLISFARLHYEGLRLQWFWRKPSGAWKGFGGDFFRRILAGSSFQINQTVDMAIAGLLVAGSITSFTLGTTLGHFLLSVVGFSVSSSLFPRLVSAQTVEAQKPIMRRGIQLILLVTIPASLLAFGLSDWGLRTFFDLSGDRLWMTSTVFRWTVLSLPMACLIPLFSRSFLARQDTKTPLVINFVALGIATALAAVLSLLVFEDLRAILGLAIGNFVANTLSLGLYVFTYYYRRSSQSAN